MKNKPGGNMNRKIFVSLALIFFFAAFALPVKARRIGAEVNVTMIDGSVLRGELRTIDPEWVSVCTDSNGFSVARRLKQVASVRLLSMPGEKRHLGLGGALFGMLIGAALGTSSKARTEILNLRPLWTIPLGTSLGYALFSSLKLKKGERIDRLFQFQGQDEEARTAAVKELNEQARDVQ
jgi:hypothetical protein